MKYLLFDAGNILYRTFYAHKGEDDITVAGLAANTALLTLNKYFKLYKPNKVVMAFDRHSWRKDYMAEDGRVSVKPYKGNRRQNMTKKEEEKYQLFLQHVEDFEEMIRDHTAIASLACDGLEADDVIAGMVQTLEVTEPDSEVILVSQDKDMIQLLRHPNLRIIDPATGDDRTLDDWDGDADLFMFEKCIRGDGGDHVQSAYPRVRSTRIRKAYEDDYEKANMMEHEWELPINEDETKTVKVKDLFKENIILMDLTAQPDDIQKSMVKTVLIGLRNPGKFDFFSFLRFLGKYEMQRVADNVDSFIPMLSS